MGRVACMARDGLQSPAPTHPCPPAGTWRDAEPSTHLHIYGYEDKASTTAALPLPAPPRTPPPLEKTPVARPTPTPLQDSCGPDIPFARALLEASACSKVRHGMVMLTLILGHLV